MVRDDPVAALADLMCAFPSVEKVILYGSRAKGTHSLFSDIDIAVTGVKDDREWTHIQRLADVEDSPVRTLLKIDLARFEKVDASLQKSIMKEGKVLYERY